MDILKGEESTCERKNVLPVPFKGRFGAFDVDLRDLILRCSDCLSRKAFEVQISRFEDVNSVSYIVSSLLIYFRCSVGRVDSQLA